LGLFVLGESVKNPVLDFWNSILETDRSMDDWMGGWMDFYQKPMKAISNA